jgi:hypothetical protein
MAILPNGAGGYQVGDGNLTEATLSVSSIPTALTVAATLTTAALAGGLVVYTSASTADLTLPAVTVVNADLSSAKVNSAFDVALVATSTGVPTIVVGTGWTLVGSGAGVASKSVLFRAVKTGAETYNLYRIAG